jgi:hypothetical protein
MLDPIDYIADKPELIKKFLHEVIKRKKVVIDKDIDFLSDRALIKVYEELILMVRLGVKGKSEIKISCEDIKQ